MTEPLWTRFSIAPSANHVNDKRMPNDFRRRAKKLTDEEILLIRAWLSTLAEIAIEVMESKK